MSIWSNIKHAVHKAAHAVKHAEDTAAKDAERAAEAGIGFETNKGESPVMTRSTTPDTIGISDAADNIGINPARWCCYHQKAGLSLGWDMQRGLWARIRNLWTCEQEHAFWKERVAHLKAVKAKIDAENAMEDERNERWKAEGDTAEAIVELDNMFEARSI